MLMARAELKKALVVEDSEEISTLIATLLEGQSYSVFCASTLHEATSMALGHQFSLAVVDGSLPDGHSVKLVQTLAQSGARIILMSGNLEAEAPFAGLPYPKLLKPFRLRAFMELVTA